ncbi:PHP domain-containing protein [Patescibacteria group bacterium]|nr:PHP domain-containing protein [Patescibacteria group bacterium]
MSKYKASLHIHSAEDKNESFQIKYNVYELIDYAYKKNFKILALTFHNFYGYKQEFSDYAKSKNILLIPGIEASLYDDVNSKQKSHTVILNCDKDIEEVKSLSDLKKYKQEHPEIFIISPHPLFGLGMSIGEKKLKENIDLFDAIEHSWFYHRLYNKNKKVQTIAQDFKKPFIATSDLHHLKHLDDDYVVINATSLDTEIVFNSLKAFKYKNISKPKSLFRLIKTMFLIYF